MSPQLMTFYSCSLVAIRFLDGISWNYSPLLIHEQPDTETSLFIKVAYNLLLWLKQLYREDNDIGPLIKLLNEN